MKKFLSDFMRTHKTLSDERKKKFTTLFSQTTSLVVNSLGQKPFHLHRGLNAAVYDSVFTAFARHVGQYPGSPSSKDSARLVANYNKLTDNDQYSGYTSSATTDKDVVPKRVDLAEFVLFG